MIAGRAHITPPACDSCGHPAPTLGEVQAHPTGRHGGLNAMGWQVRQGRCLCPQCRNHERTAGMSERYKLFSSGRAIKTPLCSTFSTPDEPVSQLGIEITDHDGRFPAFMVGISVVIAGKGMKALLSAKEARAVGAEIIAAADKLDAGATVLVSQ